MKHMVLLLLLLTACRREREVTGPKMKALLSATDVVVLKRFFGATQILSTPPSDSPGQFVSLYWTAGQISIEPVAIEQQGKSGSKLRGARIEVTALRSRETEDGRTVKEDGGEHREAVLDEDELNDLAAAVAYMDVELSTWRKQKPSVKTEVEFESRDSFVVLIDESDDRYVCKIGEAVVILSSEQAVNFKKAVEKTLSTLKAN